MVQWQWVDIAIIGVIGLSVLTGLFRGFAKEFVALCVWVLALWLGYHYADSLDPWLSGHIQDKTVRTVVAFVGILIATLLAGGIVNTILSFILKRTGLSGTDRTLGMCFGFLRGVFIVALIMAAIKMTSFPYQQYTQDSTLYAHFDPVVNWMSERMPAVIKQVKTVDAAENIIDTVPTA